jgi:hypothetical protein
MKTSKQISHNIIHLIFIKTIHNVYKCLNYTGEKSEFLVKVFLIFTIKVNYKSKIMLGRYIVYAP